MIVRYLFRCQEPSCGKVWAFDYQDRGKWRDPARPFSASPTGFTTPAIDKVRGCDRCKTRKRPTMAKVRGAYSAAVTCDERCTKARSASCTCSCGGANHGRDFVAAR